MNSKERFKLTPAVHLLLIKDDQILLLKRFNTGWEDGNYSVVAGHADGDEEMTKAMAREGMEEAGVELGSMQLGHVMHRRRDTDSERVDFFFVVDDWDGIFENKEPHKCDHLDLFPLDDLPSNMVPYIRSAIEHYLKDNLYSEFGW